MDDRAWKQLLEVRSRQRTQAQEAFVRALNEEHLSRARCQHAEQALSVQIEDKRSLMARTLASRATPYVSSEVLSDIEIWSKVLAKKIVDLRLKFEAAQEAWRQSQAVVAQKRDLLDAAVRALEKAQQMQKKIQAGRARQIEQRANDTLDEVAGQVWLAQRSVVSTP